jgi:hypothetical protein
VNACCASWSPEMGQVYRGGWLWLLGGMCLILNVFSFQWRTLNFG